MQLGASWATHPAIAARPTFRNFYQSAYGYGLATFRLAASAPIPGTSGSSGGGSEAGGGGGV